MSMNREERRNLQRRLAPIARRIVELEKKVKAGIDKEESEQKITEIMDNLSMIEIIAIDDYIQSKKLIDSE